MTITLLQLVEFLPVDRAHLFFPFLQKYLPQYEIDTPTEIQTFMAQAAHESINFSALSEHLSYSEEAILATFKKYFKKPADAKSFARNPEKLANRVYANRMGNGSEASGDGYRFRGRGIFQLTGKTWYELFGAQGYGDMHKFTTNPDLLATPEYAVHSACWFFHMKNLGRFAAKMANPGTVDPLEYFKEQTISINGGLNGIVDRIALFHKAEKIFK